VVENSAVENGAGIVVSVRKYDGAEHRRWPARIAKIERPLLVLDAVFDEEIEHDLLGTISPGTISTEYYWLDRWYNVFRFSDPNGNLKNFYCNVNEPPSFDGRVLSYVDLDIDVLVAPDLTYKILDVGDFEENARRYDYPNDVQVNARQALTEVIELIEARAFPFNE
jgi:protein associated with RNAse G/E